MKLNKEDKYFRVSMAILNIIMHEGIDRVTHSNVSRRAKVSRAWIYEYVGKKKSDLIELAAETVGQFYSRFALTSVRFNDRMDFHDNLFEAAEFVFKCAIDFPIISKIYFCHRGNPNAIGLAIHKFENHWLSTWTPHFKKFLDLESQQAKQAAQMILLLRLSLAHFISTSQKPDQSFKEAKQIMAAHLTLIRSEKSAT